MPVLGHAGGIDEIAFVVMPIMIFLVLQWLSRRKAGEEVNTEASAIGKFERRQAMAGMERPVEDDPSPDEGAADPGHGPSSSPS